MQYFGVTDIGLRRWRNEDAWYADAKTGLCIICDGMGGHKGGDVASNTAIQVVRDKFILPAQTERIQDELLAVVEQANRKVWTMAQVDDDLTEMGTTLTAAVIADQTAWIAHVGDSSLYLIRDHTIAKLTCDHTVANEMLRDGVMTDKAERYKHVLTRALGVEAQVEVDSFAWAIMDGDVLAFCTDGMGDVLSEQEILDEVLAYPGELEQAANALVQKTLQKNGSDNITVLLVQI